MKSSDNKRFAELINYCATVYGKELKPGFTGIFFKMLEEYKIENVEKAFVQHMREGAFMPVPANIIALLPTLNKHLRKNEAWALIQALTTEEDTAIITAQMREAWAIASPVYENGDKVGARMAFMDAYSRLVASNPAIQWEVQGGSNKALKQRRVKEAIKLGRLDGGILTNYQHETNSIGFDNLKNQALLNAKKQDIEELKKKWGEISDKLKSVNQDGRENMRKAERDKAEIRRKEVLERAAQAMEGINER